MILKQRLGCSGTVFHQTLLIAQGRGEPKETSPIWGLETPHREPQLTNFKFLCGRLNSSTDGFMGQELKLSKEISAFKKEKEKKRKS